MAVIAVVTVAFVIGTVIERNSGESHEADRATEPVAHKTGGEARETAEAQTSKPGAAAEPTSAGEPSELTPLGIDIEAAPFVALAAIASLALAIAARLRPRTVPLLCLVALAMLVFAALDIQELVHQSDEARTGLAILAACVAALHLIAAALATVMIRDARRRHAGHPAGAARSPACPHAQSLGSSRPRWPRSAPPPRGEQSANSQGASERPRSSGSVIRSKDVTS